jgi:hypothetical protein
MSAPLPQITNALADAFAGLGQAVADPALATVLFAELGIEVELDEAALAELRRIAPSLERAVDEVVPIALRLLNGGEPTLVDATVVAEVAAAVAEDLLALADNGGPSLSGLPAPLQRRETWVSLAELLPAGVFTSWMRGALPLVMAPLRVAGVVDAQLDAAGRVHRTTRWALLTDLFSDPAGTVAARYGWEGELDHGSLLSAVADVACDLGLRVLWTEPVSPRTEIWYPEGLPPRVRALHIQVAADPLSQVGGSGLMAFEMVPIPATPGEEPSGLGLSNLSSAGGLVEIPLGGMWAVRLTGEVEASAALVVEWFPGAAPRVVSDQPAVDLGVEVVATPDGEWVFLGSADGPRLSVSGVSFSARLQGPATGPELTLAVGTTGEGLRLALPGGSTDSFVASVLGDEAGGALPLAIESSSDGIRLNGSPTLEFAQTLDLDIGPIHLGRLTASVGLGTLSRIDLGMEIGFDLGPFAAEIEGLGLGLLLEVRPDGHGSAGPFNLDLAVIPPNRVSFEMAAGVVSGGGFLLVDGDRYVGALNLDILAVGIDAFTLIDTSLPQDPDGFALFATLTLRFPSIPLGFGFSLSGLGGILALNRRVDAEALALGLRDGAADSILFPDDPMRDCELLVARLDEYFPISVGCTVVGPVAEISWGVGDILVGQLGVVVSLPDGVVVVLGSIEVVLPDQFAPLIELHLDTLGALDPAAGTLLVVASLYDSRLLGVIELSGDAALYVSWLTNPFFLLSVGGYHPGFEPPSFVPSVLESLRRMRAEVVVGVGVTASLDAYCAITSNSVQFGGAVEVEASAQFLLTTYTARGWVDFDVLLKFNPLVILFDASAGVGVYANDKELLGVWLAVHFEGPKPWFASGTAEFKFFGVNVDFDFLVGSLAAPALPPPADVLDLVRAELASPAAWTTRSASVLPSGIRYAGDSTGGFLRPDDQLVGRQTVAPLGRDFDRFAESRPLQTRVDLLSVSLRDPVSQAALDELVTEEETDWFAPAMFDVMSDAARLAAPSYEQMTAGVVVGSVGVGLPVGDRVDAPPGYETEVWEPVTGYTSKFAVVVAERPGDFLVAGSAPARRAVAVRATAANVPKVRVGPQRYVTVDAIDGEVIGAPVSFRQGLGTVRADSTLRLVPAGSEDR